MRHKFALIGYVLMPEHVHLLMSEPLQGNPSRVLQALKQRVSRSLRRRKLGSPKQLPLSFAEKEDSPAFWQRRFYDFNVWSEKKVKEKLQYMHRNPVARKLAAHPKDWPWSSWSYHAKGERGLIAIDSFKQPTSWSRIMGLENITPLSGVGYKQTIGISALSNVPKLSQSGATRDKLERNQSPS